VFVRDEGRCQYCGGRAESIDHVVPRSRGGEHTWENVVAACRACNTHKRDRLLEHTSMRLHRHPVAPPASTWVAATVGDVPVEWQAYLQTGALSA
jgi:5-methylcytosine-specific restriction endonuclease McrA